jgi:serine/alanine adding enzyme
MLQCVAYTEAMKEAWDRYALSHGTIYHTTAFRQLLIDSFGYQCRYHAVIDERGSIQALIPLVAGRNLGLRRIGVSLPFINYMDLCAASDEALQAAADSLKRLREQDKLAYVELRLKDDRLPDASGWKSHLHNHTFVLPLYEDEEQVLALSTGSNRNHVRKTYKNGWFTSSFDPGHLPEFYKVYVRRMKQLGSPAPKLSFFERFFELLPDNAFLLTIHDPSAGQVVGGMLLITSPGNATLYYPYGANLVEYNNKYLNNYMYWEAVRFGIRSGLKSLDLGRSQTGSGTYKYKEQWGAKPEQLTYLIYDGAGSSSLSGPPDKESLRFFIELWKKAPSFITDSAGNYLIKYLMP